MKIDDILFLPELEFFHTVQNIRHLLEAVLELEAKLQAFTSALQQLQQVSPELQHVVLASIDASYVVVVLCLKLLSNLDTQIIQCILEIKRSQ